MHEVAALNDNTVTAFPCDSARGAVVASLSVLGRRLLAGARRRRGQLRARASAAIQHRPPVGDVGLFLLAWPLEGHAVGTVVRVAVCVPDRSRLALDFGDHDETVTDACVLLCGHTGALKLIELGYTGPIIRRPRMRGDRVAFHGDLPGH
jgi:hypothetical protein